LLRNDGLDVFVDVTSGAIGHNGNGHGAAWGDYDNDGLIDLYLVNDGTVNKVYKNKGGGVFEDATVVPLGNNGSGRGAAMADIDGDGLQDIYVANTGGANLLLHNQYQLDKHWLEVRLTGTASNMAGIGARVRVVAGGISQVREVSAGSGYSSQNAMIASFGLGEAETVDSLQVFWPSGAFQDTLAVGVDQMINITEFDVSGTEVTDAHAGFGLLGGQPNPFSESTLIRYTLSRPGPVSLKVYDVSGRLVRILVDAQDLAAGTHTSVWDGKDSRGTAVASGVYYYRFESGSSASTRSVVLLR
jgi:hypothetical protein